MSIGKNIKYLLISAGFILITFSVNADSIRGPISELYVKNVGKDRVKVIVKLNDADRGGCGNAEFVITDPNWQDVEKLAKAVSSGEELSIGYRCEGRKNRILNLSW